MKRTAVTPWPFSVNLDFDQAQLIEGHLRELVFGTWDAVDANGSAQHQGDMAAQFENTADNLETVIAGADMRLPMWPDSTSTPSTLTPWFNTSPVVTERFEG